jgi:uncharacterized protein (TIGR00369 family)
VEAGVKRKAVSRRRQQKVEPAGRFADYLQAMVRGDIPQAPVTRLLGLSLTAMSEERATIEFEAGTQHTNPRGALHGGILCDTADAVMALAYGTTLAEGESFTTLELKINFLKPVWKGKLIAEGRVVKRGRTVGLTECDITDEKESLVTRASSTCMSLRGNDATGR